MSGWGLHLSKGHFRVLDLDAPRDLKTVELTDESITLEWKNSQAQVDNYRIKFGPLSGGEHGELLFPSGSKDSTQAKISGTRSHQHMHIHTHRQTILINSKMIICELSTTSRGFPVKDVVFSVVTDINAINVMFIYLNTHLHSVAYLMESNATLLP